MCNQLTLHREFRIDTKGKILSKRQTVFFTSVGLMNKEHKDLDVTNLGAPRLAWHKQKMWKKHQNTENRVDIKLAQKKGFKFYQTRSNAIILHDTLPASCFAKAVMMGFMEIMHEKMYASRRPPPKFSFTDNWMNELGSKLAGSGKKTPNKPNQRPKIQLLKQGDLFSQSNNLGRMFRKSKLFLTSLRKHQ